MMCLLMNLQCMGHAMGRKSNARGVAELAQFKGLPQLLLQQDTD